MNLFVDLLCKPWVSVNPEVVETVTTVYLICILQICRPSAVVQNFTAKVYLGLKQFLSICVLELVEFPNPSLTCVEWNYSPIEVEQ